MPLSRWMRYATQKPENPIELRIYEGENGHFTLYEDENDDYDYEKGIYATIKFDWNNKSKTLTIGKRKGSFPGMLKKRVFNIVLVKKHHGTGVAVTSNPDKTVTYMGDKLTIRF